MYAACLHAFARWRAVVLAAWLQMMWVSGGGLLSARDVPFRLHPRLHSGLLSCTHTEMLKPATEKRCKVHSRRVPHAQFGAMALLVLATWLLMWFSGGGLLSAHYIHFRLRLRSQLGLLLLRRRTWLVVTVMVALDSFCISLNTSYVFKMPDVRALSPCSYLVSASKLQCCFRMDYPLGNHPGAPFLGTCCTKSIFCLHESMRIRTHVLSCHQAKGALCGARKQGQRLPYPSTSCTLLTLHLALSRWSVSQRCSPWLHPGASGHIGG